MRRRFSNALQALAWQTPDVDSMKAQVDAYVRTGESDPGDWVAWPGPTTMAKMSAHHDGLIDGLIAEIRRRTRNLELPPEPVIDFTQHVRGRLEPMVRGLLPRAVQEPALARLVAGVRLVTPATIEDLLQETSWLSTAWDVANLYLDTVSARPLDADGWAPLGLESGDVCYVSLSYFDKNGRFDDYVVHEAAHMLNDTKRRHVGLPEVRRKEWLLGIWFKKRELFAYSCETWSRVVALARRPADRRELVEEIARDGPVPNDETVEFEEFVDVLRAAAAARNGWKRILERCQQPKLAAGRPEVNRA